MDITLAGSNGRIQASYHKSDVKDAPVAVVFHDSPENGGSMNEPVNYTLFYSFLKLGFSVLRFNFRGIGGTEGDFEGGESELADASTAVDWIQRENEDSKHFWLSGVGFGGWIALQMLMRRIEITGYVAVRPPLRQDMTFFNPAPCNGLIIGAKDDQNLSESEINDFIKTVNKQKSGKATSLILPDSPDFKNSMGKIYTSVSDYVQKAVIG